LHHGRAASKLESMVASSTHDLEEQHVWLLDFGFRHIDVHEKLAGQRMKLKFRMNGITYWKSVSIKAVMNGSGQALINLNTAARAVFEGGNMLSFELCKSGCFGSSSTLASCNVTLQRALQTVDIGSTHASVWNLELRAAGAPDKVFASLLVDVCIRTSRLQAVGGMEALKALMVPTPPAGLGNHSGVTVEHTTACIIFAEQAIEARRKLEEAFNLAVKAVLGEGPHNVSLPRSKMEQLFRKLATLPELPEGLNDDQENIATPIGFHSRERPCKSTCHVVSS